MKELQAIEEATRRYRETSEAHEQARQAVTAAVLAGLRARERPTDVTAKSPFTPAYVRRLARENGIPEYLLQRYPRARAELEAHMPAWRDAGAAIAELGIGLEDTEFVGGVLWHGLTRQGGEGNPDEQARVIVDRLVRWATRDGGDGAKVAAAVGSVLDEYLLARQKGRAEARPVASAPNREDTDSDAD